MGAWLNVKINCAGYEDKAFVDQTLSACETIVQEVNQQEASILQLVHQKIANG